MKMRCGQEVLPSGLGDFFGWGMGVRLWNVINGLRGYIAPYVPVQLSPAQTRLPIFPRYLELPILNRCYFQITEWAPFLVPGW